MIPEKNFKSTLVVLGTLFHAVTAQAVQFEAAGTALSGILGTIKPFSKKLKNSAGKDVTVYYTKDAAGKPALAAVVENGLYPPNCTHTWAIGMDAKSAQVKSIRVIEMSCQHAFPTRAASYLDQYTGKGPADLKKLSDDVHVISKATGSSQLTTDAVKRSVEFLHSQKGNL